jgi:hypothetical protein
VTTRGVLFIHAAPAALCPHVEWAAGDALGARVALEWTPQPAEPGMLRAELSWQGAAGAAAAIASALRGWRQLRFEVTEEPSAGAEGERYACTPSLGLFHATTGVHGDIMVGEERLRAAVARVDEDPERSLAEEIDVLLGTAWDAELEPFRHAGEGAPVRWLHQVV